VLPHSYCRTSKYRIRMADTHLERLIGMRTKSLCLEDTAAKAPLPERDTLRRANPEVRLEAV